MQKYRHKYLAGQANCLEPESHAGLLRGILIVAEQRMIIDPILNSLSDFLRSVPTYAFTTLLPDGLAACSDSCRGLCVRMTRALR